MTESKSPQWHYEESERLLTKAKRHTPSIPAWERQAQIHATLALAGFTRDAVTGHVHGLGADGDSGPMIAGEVTQPGRPA